MRSSTSSDTRISRPCSSQVYQDTLTPESAATSSRLQAIRAFALGHRQPQVGWLDASPATAQKFGAL